MQLGVHIHVVSVYGQDTLNNLMSSAAILISGHVVLVYGLDVLFMTRCPLLLYSFLARVHDHIIINDYVILHSCFWPLIIHPHQSGACGLLVFTGYTRSKITQKPA